MINCLWEIIDKEGKTKMKIQTVAILGAGAVGSYFIWGLSEKLGENLWVIADGERKLRLETSGKRINGKQYSLHVRTSREAKGADLLLVATKYGALKEALGDIAEITAENTIVLSLLNGVDSEEIIASRIGKEHLMYSMMQIASQRSGDEITFHGPSTPGLMYGEPEDSKPSERMMAIEELLSDTPLHYQMRENIKRDIWYKYAFNVSMNIPQAIVGCGVGAYAVSESMTALRMRLRDEVCAVAAAMGIDISELSPLEKLEHPSADTSRYSTLQDLDAGRRTENEMFSGTVVRLGEKYGVPTPYNEYAYFIIRALEEKNDGKFDFS